MSPYTTVVDSDTVARMLQNPHWIIVDCRFRLDDPRAGRALYQQSHIAGALYSDLNEDLSGPPGGDGGRHPLPDLDDFRARLGSWGIDSDSQVVCYDDAGGAYAARLWWMLRYLGHDAVAVLDGGWQAWLARNYPTASGEERRKPVVFTGNPREEMAASLKEVADLSERGGLLIDSREPARYRGEVEPIDRVAGHIPGAINRPFKDNLDAEGTLRQAEALALEWRAVLGDEEARDAVVYCGSGVSACQNLLALEHAGLRGARLFIPSWSGWSADPARPVEHE